MMTDSSSGDDGGEDGVDDCCCNVVVIMVVLMIVMMVGYVLKSNNFFTVTKDPCKDMDCGETKICTYDRDTTSCKCKETANCEGNYFLKSLLVLEQLLHDKQALRSSRNKQSTSGMLIFIETRRLNFLIFPVYFPANTRPLHIMKRLCLHSDIVLG